jgi:hypothetical protein
LRLLAGRADASSAGIDAVRLALLDDAQFRRG